MRKILFMILSVMCVFSLVACGESGSKNSSASTSDTINENAYIDTSIGRDNIITDIKPSDLFEYEPNAQEGAAPSIPEINGYDYNKKGFYYLKYNTTKVEESCSFQVQFYKKDNKVILFNYSNTCVICESLAPEGYCNNFINTYKRDCRLVELKENSMTNEECGNKEGEVVNKILNAIENKTYFDY